MIPWDLAVKRQEWCVCLFVCFEHFLTSLAEENFNSLETVVPHFQEIMPLGIFFVWFLSFYVSLEGSGSGDSSLKLRKYCLKKKWPF